MKSEKVHFKVDFDHMNDIAREEWQDWNFEWVLDLMESLGLNREAANLVLSGSHRMAQDPEGVEGVHGMLVKDNYQPHHNNCRFGLFIHPETYQRGTMDILFQGQKYIQQAKQVIIMAINDYNQEMYSFTRWNIAKKLKEEYPKDVWQACGIPYAVRYEKVSKQLTKTHFIDLELVQDYLIEAWQYISPNGNYKSYLQKPSPPKREIPLIPGTDLTLESFINRQQELDKMGLPKPVKPEESENGYITPNGKFYPCQWMEHKWLTLVIEEELGVKEEFLVKCAVSQITPDLKECFIDNKLTLTKKQKETALDYCLAFNVKLPDWLKGE